MTTNLSLAIRLFQPGDEPVVVDLWHRCKLVVPWNDPHHDIALKMGFQPELFFVGEVDGQVVATLMAGYEGHRGWINYLAVDPRHQRQGIGRRMMAHAEAALRELGCPKINLQVRETNLDMIAFYERVGFSSDHVIGLGKHLNQESNG